MSSKPNLNVAITGGHKCGKSTVLRQLLQNSNQHSTNQFIDYSHTTELTFHYFSSENCPYDITYIDSPGDLKYLNKVIRGICIADVVINVIQMNTSENFASLVNPYCQIAICYGALRTIICVNVHEQDHGLKYQEIKTDVEKSILKAGLRINNIQIIIVNALEGLLSIEDNQDSPQIGLQDIIYNIQQPVRIIDAPLRIQTVQTYKRKRQTGISCVAKVCQGIINAGQIVQLMTSNMYCKVHGLIYKNLDRLSIGRLNSSIKIFLSLSCNKTWKHYQQCLESFKIGEIIYCLGHHIRQHKIVNIEWRNLRAAFIFKYNTMLSRNKKQMSYKNWDSSIGQSIMHQKRSTRNDKICPNEALLYFFRPIIGDILQRLHNSKQKVYWSFINSKHKGMEF